MKVRVLNLGAGVQSTAIAIMAQMNAEAIEAALPMPYPVVGLVEYAIFGDTGDEPLKVYLHLCWLAERCSSMRLLVRSIHPKRNRILQRVFPFVGPVDIRRARRCLVRLRRIEAGTLRGSLLLGENSSGQRAASIPAFTWDGKTLRMTRRGLVRDEGKVKRQCTAEWKIDAVERTIRREIFGRLPGHRIPAGSECEQVFGLSYDESGRVMRVRRNFQAIPWASPSFPLHEMEQTRGGCVAWLRKYGPPYKVGRSACIECPLRGNDEWREMRDEDPASFEEACRIDERMRLVGAGCARVDASLYLHKSCVPLREAAIDVPDSKKLQEVFGFAQECEGMCGL